MMMILLYCIDCTTCRRYTLFNFFAFSSFSFLPYNMDVSILTYKKTTTSSFLSDGTSSLGFVIQKPFFTSFVDTFQLLSYNYTLHHVVNFLDAIVNVGKEKEKRFGAAVGFWESSYATTFTSKLWFLKFWVFSDRVCVCVDIPKDYVPVDGQTILFTTCHGSPIIFQKLAAKPRWHGPRSTVSKQGSGYEHIFQHSSL